MYANCEVIAQLTTSFQRDAAVAVGRSSAAHDGYDSATETSIEAKASLAGLEPSAALNS